MTRTRLREPYYSLSPPCPLHSKHLRVYHPQQNHIEMQLQRRARAVDQQIQDLIEQLQQFEHTSSKGRKALTRLLIIIQGHPDLYRSSHRDYSEALNRTLEWVCKNIQSFEPRPPSIEQSLIRWINGYLKWRVRDLFTTNHTPSLDRPISNKEGESTTLMDRLEDPNAITNLEGWIEQTQKERRLSIGDTVWEYIEKDPENLLKNCYPKKQPECHCQILAIRLLLQQPPHKISEIAREYNISNQTLYSHWKRKCLPLLQTIGDQISKRFGLEK